MNECKVDVKKKDIDAAWNRMNKLQSTRELFRLMLIGSKKTDS